MERRSCRTPERCVTNCKLDFKDDEGPGQKVASSFDSACPVMCELVHKMIEGTYQEIRLQNWRNGENGKNAENNYELYQTQWLDNASDLKTFPFLRIRT